MGTEGIIKEGAVSSGKCCLESTGDNEEIIGDLRKSCFDGLWGDKATGSQ